MNLPLHDNWPEQLSANAWAGAPAAGALAPQARTWAMQRHFPGEPLVLLHAPELPRPEDWLNPEIGWGLVLPDDPSYSNVKRARAVGAPEPVRRLAVARTVNGDPAVFRYRPGEQVLFRHYTDGGEHPIVISGGPRGSGPGKLPRYLLLCGTPEELPWELQFRLNLSAFTGRLDLDEEGLERYVEAALSNWAGSAADPTAPLLWTVEDEPGDITWLMRQTIAEPVYRRWQGDAQIGARARRLAGDDATPAGLATELAEHPPGVLVTTSHGMTGPLDRPAELRRDLGLPVGAGHGLVTADGLLANWQPDGVVWYAHACCSAGASGTNPFDGLVAPDTVVHQVLTAVAALGPMTAPLPRALLGAARPARAFIGHVQPTFDWTLRRIKTGQITVSALLQVLYDHFHLKEPSPVGRAFGDYYLEAAVQLAEWVAARRDVGQDRPNARPHAAVSQLTGIDRQCTVILGDPAVAPASLPSS
ncbi:hypothetical protein ACWCXK_38660 [Streptomyces sp. NPDC001739]